MVNNKYILIYNNNNNNDLKKKRTVSRPSKWTTVSLPAAMLRRCCCCWWCCWRCDNQFPASRSPQRPLRTSTSCRHRALNFRSDVPTETVWRRALGVFALAGGGGGSASSEAPPPQTETNLRLFTHPVVWVLWVSCLFATCGRYHLILNTHLFLLVRARRVFLVRRLTHINSENRGLCK